MPPESVFPGNFFHHPDHRSFWQRLHIWERVMIIIFAVVFIAAIFYRVIYPRITNCGSGGIHRKRGRMRSCLYLPWSSYSCHRFDT
ncbi:hypothetical protein A2U01_0038703, partial [Trifolium medium]|nr:hypothetical protein [Trifolium medium]